MSHWLNLAHMWFFCSVHYCFKEWNLVSMWACTSSLLWSPAIYYFIRDAEKHLSCNLCWSLVTRYFHHWLYTPLASPSQSLRAFHCRSAVASRTQSFRWSSSQGERSSFWTHFLRTWGTWEGCEGKAVFFDLFVKSFS